MLNLQIPAVIMIQETLPNSPSNSRIYLKNIGTFENKKFSSNHQLIVMTSPIKKKSKFGLIYNLLGTDFNEKKRNNEETIPLDDDKVKF